MNMRFLKKNYGLLLILVLSFWAIKPFFIQGFFPMHDDTQVARVFEMGKVLQSGVFPVRWVPDLGYGYGYPIFNFYAPLAYYVGGVFMLLGFDALLATKIMMVLGVLLSGIFMYFLARKFFGELGGVVSGIFYLYAPYHAVDIYARGDAAEFWAYAFIPLAFLGFYRGSILIGSIGFAAIILSHNLTALMVTPFLVITALLNCYIAFKYKKSFIINPSSLIIILGLTISAFYWAPALLEMKHTNVLSQIGGGADFRDHFVCIRQLWDSSWGFGGSTPTCIDGLSYKIGKLHILGSLFAAVLVIFYSKLERIKKIVGFSLAGFITSVFLTLEVSRFVWETIPVMAFFQYPWRFLLLASFFSALASSSLVLLLTKFKIRPYVTAIVLIFFILFFNTKLFVPQSVFPAVANDFTNEVALKWTTSKTSDEFLPPDFKKPKSKYEISKKHIEFKETSIEKSSNLVSLIGALALIIGIIARYGKNKR